MENKVISVVSGGFDPVHPGHIMMMNDCLDFSDYLVVGVNSNQWLINKKGNFFMDIKHRLYVINNLATVNEAIEFEDDSNGSASNLLINIRKKFRDSKKFLTERILKNYFANITYITYHAYIALPNGPHDKSRGTTYHT